MLLLYKNIKETRYSLIVALDEWITSGIALIFPPPFKFAEKAAVLSTW